MSSRTTGMSATPSGGGTSGGARARSSAMDESTDESTHPTNLLGRLSSPAAEGPQPPREPPPGSKPMLISPSAPRLMHMCTIMATRAGRGESDRPASRRARASVRSRPPPSPTFCVSKKTRDTPLPGTLGTAVQSENCPKLGRQPKSSTAPCTAAQRPVCSSVFHVSRKVADRTARLRHTRRRARRRRESRDTHASGGSQPPVESTPTRRQIHRTGAALEADATRIDREENPHPPVDSILSAVAFGAPATG